MSSAQAGFCVSLCFPAVRKLSGLQAALGGLVWLSERCLFESGWEFLLVIVPCCLLGSLGSGRGSYLRLQEGGSCCLRGWIGRTEAAGFLRWAVREVPVVALLRLACESCSGVIAGAHWQ